jgi:RsiW-degrading membrane proteinase PrsW (M82 family)
MIWIALALALAPVIMIFTFVYLRDRWEREPIWMLGLVWGLGILICIPVLIQEMVGEEILKGFWPGVDPKDETSKAPLLYTFYYAFIVVAFAEEMWKYLVVRWTVYWTRWFNEPFDGIMYCVASSLGFAAIENVLYVSDGGVGVALLRMFTSVPGHAMMGVVMGYFVGRAKFKYKGLRAWIERMIGFTLAVIIHGLYDFSLMQQHWDWFILMALVVLVVGVLLGLRAMRLSRASSPFAKVPNDNNGNAAPPQI